MIAPSPLNQSQLLDKATGALRAAWEVWRASLPPEGIYWPQAALYIRESSSDSLVGDAPMVQLQSTLAMFLADHLYVPWELVVLENATGTELAARAQFQDLLDRAEAGEFKTIGAHMSSRFFRNVEEAIATKRRMRKVGVSLIWVGKIPIDPKDPSAFLLERNLEIADEWIPRQASYAVSRQKELASLKGIPIGGPLMEVWRITGRGQSTRSGRNGPALGWELVEPMASIVGEGALRYLAGHSFQDLAIWCLGTEIEGLTPKGKSMDRIWWQWNLKNPKLAGYQYRMDYTGYKPGIESPSRKALKSRELIPCLLPPVITLEQHEQIVALATSRHRSGNRRRIGYQVELLSGIAVDAQCGHILHIKRHAYGGQDFYLRCAERAVIGHGGHYRGRDAATDLDLMISRIRFDDRRLLARIEAGLERLDEVKTRARTVSTEELQLRAALNALDAEMFPQLRRQMLAQIEALHANTKEEPPSIHAPAFRAAIKDLARWPEIWVGASIEQKNQLLRAGGVKAYVEPISREGRRGGFQGADKGPHSRLVRVEAAVPEFALALAAAADQVGAPREVEPSTQSCAPAILEHGQNLLGAPTTVSRPRIVVPAFLEEVLLNAIAQDGRKLATVSTLAA